MEIIEQKLLQVVEHGDAHAIGIGPDCAFMLLNGQHIGIKNGGDRDIPIFQDTERDLMSLYAAFHLAAYRAGDLLPLK